MTQRADVPNISREMVVIIRPSFMKFCQDGCRAALFNHVLYWIARKARGQSKEAIQSGAVTWHATTEEIAEGLAGAWCAKKVRHEVNALVEMGLLGRGKNPAWGADRTKHFFFGESQCQKLLDLCQQHRIALGHIGLSDDVLQMVNILLATGLFTRCNWTIYQMPEHNTHEANGQYSTAIPKETKVSYQGSPKLAPSAQKVPLEALAIMDAWDETEGALCPRTDKHVRAATALVPCKPTREDLQQVKAFCLADNPEWYGKHGIDLQAIANNWQKWRSAYPVIPKASDRSIEAVQRASSNNQKQLEKLRQLARTRERGT